jgi:predicted RNA-binding protein with PUA-like domain
MRAQRLHDRRPRARRTYQLVVPLEMLRATKGLEEMLVIRKGSRLSIQPVTRTEFDIVSRLGRSPRQRSDRAR